MNGSNNDVVCSSADTRPSTDRVPEGVLSLVVGALSKQAEERRRYRARVARGEYERGGRPPRAVPRDAVDEMRKKGVSWGDIARYLRCSRTTLDNRRREWDDQDRAERFALAFARAREPDSAKPGAATPEPSQPVKHGPPREVYDPDDNWG